METLFTLQLKVSIILGPRSSHGSGMMTPNFCLNLAKISWSQNSGDFGTLLGRLRVDSWPKGIQLS